MRTFDLTVFKSIFAIDTDLARETENRLLLVREAFCDLFVFLCSVLFPNVRSNVFIISKVLFAYFLGLTGAFTSLKNFALMTINISTCHWTMLTIGTVFGFLVILWQISNQIRSCS